MTEPLQQELSTNIEVTRAELGETVAALANKVDVKARLSDAMTDAGHQVASALDYVAAQIRRRPVPWIVGAATVLLVLLRSRRR